MIVLMEGGFFEVEPLGMKKIVHPKKEWHGIISSNEFGLGQAACVELLF